MGIHIQISQIKVYYYGNMQLQKHPGILKVDHEVLFQLYHTAIHSVAVEMECFAEACRDYVHADICRDNV